jgi:hypothetical protein
MKERRLDKKKIIYLAVWIICMAAAIYFCIQKSGFHADEYYSYYSTELTKGLNVPENGWMQHDDYYDEFRVLKGEGFRYGLVKQIQSWDVHPPMYYWVLHTVCSMFPGTFTKWTGLGINLIFHGISLWLIMYLTQLLLMAIDNRGSTGSKQEICGDDGKSSNSSTVPIEKKTDGDNGSGSTICNSVRGYLPVIVMAVWGLSPESISEVVFIRMYAMLTMLILLTLIFHVKQMMRPQTDRLPIKEFVIPVAALTYVGFMTHYYYVVFLFFIALFFWICRIRELRSSTGLTGDSVILQGASSENKADIKRSSGIFGRIIAYPLILVIPLILGYLTYPSCLGQIFRGQRGTQAIGSFADTSNTFERIRFFADVLSKQSFGGLLFLWLVLITFILLAAKVQNKKLIGIGCPECTMTLIATVCYFLIVSKTGLLMGDESIRYIMPMCGIAVMLVLIYLVNISGQIRMRVSSVTFIIAFIMLDIFGLSKGYVQFLYKEDRAQISFAEENKSTPVIYLYDSAQKWCVWDSADELFEYPEVYFTDRAQVEEAADSSVSETGKPGNASSDVESLQSGSADKITDSSESSSTDVQQNVFITDKKITGASSLVVYVARCDDETTALRGIMNSSGLDDYEKQYSDTYCDVYLFK